VRFITIKYFGLLTRNISCRSVKSQFPKVRVRLISAYGDSDYQEQAIDSGAKEFFTKPIDFASLKQEMQEIMDED